MINDAVSSHILVLLVAETDVFDASRGSVIVRLVLLLQVLLIVVELHACAANQQMGYWAECKHESGTSKAGEECMRRYAPKLTSLYGMHWALGNNWQAEREVAAPKAEQSAKAKAENAVSVYLVYPLKISSLVVLSTVANRRNHKPHFRCEKPQARRARISSPHPADL